MKKIIIMLLCVVMLLGMTACGKEPSPGPEKTIGLGEGYLDDRKFQLAFEQFLRYIDMEPEDEYGYLYAAEAYIGMNDIDKAVDILEKGYVKTGSERIQKELDVLSASAVTEAASEPSSENASAATSEDTVQNASDDMGHPVAVELQDGEVLYTGILDCSQAESFRVSFILSADRKNIHDIKFELTDFKASVQNGIETTTVDFADITETYNGVYPIDFEAENLNINIFNSITFLVLNFEGDSAYIELNYVYYSHDNGTTPVEIPFDTMNGDLKIETVPALSETTDSAEPSGSDVFPIQYEAYGNPYSITGYTIGMDDAGNTTVTIWGDGYDVLHFGPGGAAAAAGCEFEAGGKTFEYSGASISGGSMVFTFDTSVTPEAITVTNGDTGNEVVSFLVADEPQR